MELLCLDVIKKPIIVIIIVINFFFFLYIYIYYLVFLSDRFLAVFFFFPPFFFLLPSPLPFFPAVLDCAKMELSSTHPISSMTQMDYALEALEKEAHRYLEGVLPEALELVGVPFRDKEWCIYGLTAPCYFNAFFSRIAGILFTGPLSQHWASRYHALDLLGHSMIHALLLADFLESPGEDPARTSAAYV